MTEEEMRSKMEFIVEQQAQFAAGIQKLEELHAQALVRMTKAEDRMTKAEDRLTRLEDVVLRFANATEARFTALDEKMQSLTEKMEALVVSQTHTDQRLDTLIDIIMQDRNGRSQS